MLIFGFVTLAWPEYYDWLQPHRFWSAQIGWLFARAASVAEIFGGAAIQFPRTAKAGAAVLGAVYLIFALLCVPRIFAKPQIYDRWGNYFEQLSLALGAALVYACQSSIWTPPTACRIGRILLGTCSVSFALEQAVYLDATTKLVPKWLPPNQMFWAALTTVAFVLAAAGLFANRSALLASRLLTIMLLIFCFLVWVPLLILQPHDRTNWTESFESFAIAGVAWILADLLVPVSARLIDK